MVNRHGARTALWGSGETAALRAGGGDAILEWPHHTAAPGGQPPGRPRVLARGRRVVDPEERRACLR